MPTTTAFASPLNNIASSLAVDYTAGSGTMVLFAGTGADILAALTAQGLPSISAAAPLRYSVARVRAVNLQTGDLIIPDEQAIYLATGLSGDVLLGLTTTEGTVDQPFYAGDIFKVEDTAGQVVAEQAAINALENTVVAVVAAPYLTQTVVAGLPSSQAMSSLATGLVKNTTGTGVQAIATPNVDYVAPGGVAGGQTVNGGTAAGNNLALNSTTNGSKGFVQVGNDGSFVGINTPAPARNFHATGVSTVGRIQSTSAASHGIFEVWAGGLSTAGTLFNIGFVALDSGLTARTYAGIGCVLDDVGPGTFSASLQFRIAVNGTLGVSVAKLSGVGNFIPTSTLGTQAIGSATNRWQVFATTLNISGLITGTVNGLLSDHGGQVFNVKAYGALGDGSTDDTTAIRAAITAATTPGGVVYFPSGTYSTTGALSLPSHVILQGVGNGSVIQPSLTYAGGANHGIVEIIGSSGLITGAGVRDLILDTRGQQRSAANAISFQIILSNAERCAFDNVIFRDHGYGSLPTDLPSDPCLLMAAKDFATDLGVNVGGPTSYPTVLVGPSQYHTVRRCKFEGTSTAQFAIRILTDWTARRATSASVNFCQGTTLDGNLFTGSYGWNVVEFAGGATRQNIFIGNRFKGTFATLTCIDLDKGCNYNIVIGNTIEGLTKPSYYISDPTTRVAAIDDHGLPATDVSGAGGAYYSEANRIIGNTIGPIDSPTSTDTFESAISVSASIRSLVMGNAITSVNATNANGNGMVIGECSELTVCDNAFKGVAIGVRSDQSATSRYKTSIDNNDVESTSSCIALNGTTAASGSLSFGVVIRGNRLTTSGTSVQIILLGNEVSNPIIDGNTCQGGGESITTNCPSPIVSNNICRSNTATAIRNYQGGVISGNQSIACANDVLFSGTASSTTHLYMAANSFTTVLAKSAAYTMTIANEFIEVNAASAPVTITLIDARLIPGQVRKVAKIDAVTGNAVSVASVLNQTISGTNGTSSPRTITTQWQVLTLLSDGANWFVQ